MPTHVRNEDITRGLYKFAEAPADAKLKAAIVFSEKNIPCSNPPNGRISFSGRSNISPSAVRISPAVGRAHPRTRAINAVVPTSTPTAPSSFRDGRNAATE